MGLLFTVLGYVMAAGGGAVVALKAIAPKTKTKKDDVVLKKLEEVKQVLDTAVPMLRVVLDKK